MRKLILTALWVFCVNSGAAGANPVPFVSLPLVPTAVAPGGPAFTLTVNGCGFVPGAMVNWNGQPLATAFVSGSQLTAVVPAANVAMATTASVTVVNPDVGAASNAVPFQAVNPGSTVYFGDAPGSHFTLGDSGPPNHYYNTAAALALASFSNDGKQPIALAVNSGSGGFYLEQLSSNGDGTFTPAPSETPMPQSSDYLSAGDFRGSGRLDLAWVSYNNPVSNPSPANTVYVLLNNGDGTFSLAPGSPVTVGAYPLAVAVGDFNRDGKLDLAVLNGVPANGNPNSGSVNTLLGNGDGTFAPAPGSPVSGLNSPVSLTAGDFNGDGVLDLAVAGADGSTYVLLGNGDGTFRVAQGSPFQAGALYPFATIAADFNGDGKLDLAELSTGVNPATERNGTAFGIAVRVLLGNGDGTFTQVPDCCGYTDHKTYGWAMVAGDFNGDGKLDLAISNEEETQPVGEFVQLLLGNGDGTFSPTDYSVFFNVAGLLLGAGDFNPNS